MQVISQGCDRFGADCSSYSQTSTLTNSTLVHMCRLGADCSSYSQTSTLTNSTLVHMPLSFTPFDSLLTLHNNAQGLACNGMFFVMNTTHICSVGINYTIYTSVTAWNYDADLRTNCTGVLRPITNAVILNVYNLTERSEDDGDKTLYVYTGPGAYGPLQPWGGVRPALSDEALVLGVQAEFPIGVAEDVGLLWDWGYNCEPKYATRSTVITTGMSVISSMTSIRGNMPIPKVPSPPRSNLTQVKMGVWDSTEPGPTWSSYVNDVFVSEPTADYGSTVTFSCNLAVEGYGLTQGECTSDAGLQGISSTSAVLNGDGLVNNSRYIVSGLYDSGVWGGKSLGGWNFFETGGCVTVVGNNATVSFTLELGTLGLMQDAFTLRRLWLTEDIGSGWSCVPSGLKITGFNIVQEYGGGTGSSKGVLTGLSLDNVLAVPIQLGSNITTLGPGYHAFNGGVQCRFPFYRYETLRGEICFSEQEDGSYVVNTRNIVASGDLSQECTITDLLIPDRVMRVSGPQTRDNPG